MSQEAILSSRLAYDYLDWPENWMDVRPLTHNRQLALLNPGEGEVQFYRELGWDVRVFAFSQGILLLWHELEVAANWLSLRDLSTGEWSLLSEMDAVVMNRGLGMFEDPAPFLEKVLALIPDSAPFYIQVENSRYYQFLLRAASRENPPCRNYYVRTREFSRESLTQLLGRLEALKSHQWEDVKDERYFDPGRDRYKTITGPDCFLRLPFDSTREDYFIKFFNLKLEGEQDILSALPKIFSSQMTHTASVPSTEAPTPSAPESQSLVQEPVSSQHSPQSEVELALEQGDVIRASTLFKNIELAPGDIAQDWIFNMKGLLAFYQDNAHNAYLLFLDAIEQNPINRDYYLNLMDAALKIGREDEVKRLLRSTLKIYPQLQGLDQELDQL